MAPGVDEVIKELDALRTAGPDKAAIVAQLKQSDHLDGPACRFNSANPAPDLKKNVQDKAEAYDMTVAGLFWCFRNQQMRISKAMKLDYAVGGTPHSVLIGFVGSAGGM